MVAQMVATLAAWMGGLRRDEGQGMVEYGLIIALIAVVVIGVMTVLGKQVSSMFCTVVTTLGGTCPT